MALQAHSGFWGFKSSSTRIDVIDYILIYCVTNSGLNVYNPLWRLWNRWRFPSYGPLVWDVLLIVFISLTACPFIFIMETSILDILQCLFLLKQHLSGLERHEGEHMMTECSFLINYPLMSPELWNSNTTFLWIWSDSNELMSEAGQNQRAVEWCRDDHTNMHSNFIICFSFTCLALSLCSSWRVELLIRIWVFEGQTEINMDCDVQYPKPDNKGQSHRNVDIFWSLLNENRQGNRRRFCSREIVRSECAWCVWLSLYPSITLLNNIQERPRTVRFNMDSLWPDGGSVETTEMIDREKAKVTWIIYYLDRGRRHHWNGFSCSFSNMNNSFNFFTKLGFWKMSYANILLFDQNTENNNDIVTY